MSRPGPGASPVAAGAAEDDDAPGYGAHDRQRWVAEPPKGTDRGPFARDRARVLHSGALRRLAAKTQVVDPQTDDFVRNRLTHSLEVAQVGRELGQALGCAPDVVETACLAHDLGHPPFGHNGEAVLNELAADIGGFEGNAQTLRLLTRLEPKVFDPVTGRPAGLNLTRAGLDACTKYPWQSGDGPSGGPAAKFGVYAEDLPVFTWLREGAASTDGGSPRRSARRCVEAQVMDVSDDIAYSVHDVEDAVVGGLLDPASLADPGVIAEVVARTQEWYLPDAPAAELTEALARLRALPAWVGGFDGGRRSLAALKDLTSQLIGRFTRAAEAATRACHDPSPVRLTRYAADVVLPRPTSCEISMLKGIAAVFVMTLAERRPLYQRQQDVLAELYAVLLERGEGALAPQFAADWRLAAERPDADRACRRVVLDQIASLTDPGAMAWHEQLTRG